MYYLAKQSRSGIQPFRHQLSIQHFMAAAYRVAQRKGIAIYAWACCPERVEFLLGGSHYAVLAFAKHLFRNHQRKEHSSCRVWCYGVDMLLLKHSLIRYMVFIEHLPVRLYHTKTAAEYRWSSANYHLGHRSELYEQPSDAYLDLADSMAKRQDRYLAFMQEELLYLRVTMKGELDLPRLSRAI